MLRAAALNTPTACPLSGLVCLLICVDLAFGAQNIRTKVTMRKEFIASSLLWAAALGTAVLPRQYAPAAAKYALQKGPLDTPWTESVGTNPWPEYPRPRLQRALWKNLNGVWQWQNASAGSVLAPPTGQALAREVLIPSCLESALSGMRFSSR
jgi:hypothetical protein